MNYMNKEFKRQLPANSVYKGSAQTHRQETDKGVAAAICRIPHSRSFHNSAISLLVPKCFSQERTESTRLITLP